MKSTFDKEINYDIGHVCYSWLSVDKSYSLFHLQMGVTEEDSDRLYKQLEQLEVDIKRKHGLW